MTNATTPTYWAVANTSTYDYDYDYEEPVPVEKNAMSVGSMVVYSLAFVLGVTGNGLVIFITGFRMKKTVNAVWFLNLAVADFVFMLFLPLSIAYLALGKHWPLGLAMCKFNSTVTFLNMYASVYLLTVISVDRCVSVRCPVWAQNHRTPRLASFVVLGVWVLAWVLSSPKLYFRQTGLDFRNHVRCFDNYSHTQQPAPAVHRAVVAFHFTFSFVVPFGVIVCSYCAVLLRLRRSRLSPSNKPFKVITAVIVAFFVCWLPYHIFCFLDTEIPYRDGLRSVVSVGYSLTFSLACLNSCLNPVLYVFMGHDFKEQLRRSLFSAFENAFAEQSYVDTTNTRSSLTHELKSL